ncbi:hypothetical protein LR48_Vigan10g079500 [Vigna angularis]|uniref:Uncharacterized protein n=1 Tax=Phaseolus angularis TaxID=3914 RepID=A0A0L9VIS9_PHAAN|nr:hypothetical protein LR48_Vigan10g079500 [Vigna angularis]
MARRRNRTARWMARGLESAICLAIFRVGVYHANDEFAAGELAHVIGTKLMAESSVRLGRDLATAPVRLKIPPKVLVTKRRRLLFGRLRPLTAVPGGATEADGRTRFGGCLYAGSDPQRGTISQRCSQWRQWLTEENPGGDAAASSCWSSLIRRSDSSRLSAPLVASAG